MMGYQFYRQKPIGDYIVDFFCAKMKLVIEIDGESHYGREKQDMEKTNFLESIGLTVLRFDDDQVKQGLEYVLIDIENWILQNEKIENESQKK